MSKSCHSLPVQAAGKVGETAIPPLYLLYLPVYRAAMTTPQGLSEMRIFCLNNGRPSWGSAIGWPTCRIIDDFISRNHVSWGLKQSKYIQFLDQIILSNQLTKNYCAVNFSFLCSNSVIIYYTELWYGYKVMVFENVYKFTKLCT